MWSAEGQVAVKRLLAVGWLSHVRLSARVLEGTELPHQTLALL